MQLSVALFAGDAVRTPNTAEINSFGNGFSCGSKESVSLGMLSGLRYKCLDLKPVRVTPQMSLAEKVRRSQLFFNFEFVESKVWTTKWFQHESRHQSVKQVSDLSAPAFCPRDYRDNSAFFVMFLSKHLTCPTLTLTRIFDIPIVRSLIDNKLQLKVLISSLRGMRRRRAVWSEDEHFNAKTSTASTPMTTLMSSINCFPLNGHLISAVRRDAHAMHRLECQCINVPDKSILKTRLSACMHSRSRFGCSL